MITAKRSAGAGLLAFSTTCGLILALSAQPASARGLGNLDAVQSEVVTERVSTAGLDLTRADHRRRMDGRIRSASRRVCDSQSFDRKIDTDQQCRRVAREGAEAQLAALVKRAERLAAAGMPAEVNTVLTVIAPGSE